MIAIKGLALAAIAGVSAIALAPRSVAGPDVEHFTIAFTYDAETSALDNYLGFLRLAERACVTGGTRGLDVRKHEQACVEDLIARLVEKMGRTDLAAVHEQRIGGHADSSRAYAAR
jgi:hypothetical protein